MSSSRTKRIEDEIYTVENGVRIFKIDKNNFIRLTKRSTPIADALLKHGVYQDAILKLPDFNGTVLEDRENEHIPTKEELEAFWKASIKKK